MLEAIRQALTNLENYTAQTPHDFKLSAYSSALDSLNRLGCRQQEPYKSLATCLEEEIKRLRETGF